MNQKEFGNFIAKLRKNKKLTQEQLGERLGVNSRTISRWENGNYMPDISLFEDLGKELDVSVLELLKCRKISKDNYIEESNKSLIDNIKKRERDKRNNIIFLLFMSFLLVILIIFSSVKVYELDQLKEGNIEYDWDLVDFSFTNYKYVNSKDVTISYRNYEILKALGLKNKEIDELTKEEVNSYINHYYIVLEEYSWYGYFGLYSIMDIEYDGISVLKLVGKELPFVKNYEEVDGGYYCVLGESKYGTNILGEYIDNKCIVTEVECSRLRDEGAVSKIDVDKYCKNS